MPAPDALARTSGESDARDLMSAQGNAFPYIYPRPDLGEHVYDPTQVVLEEDGSVPVTLKGAQEINLGDVNVDMSGVEAGIPYQFEQAATDQIATITLPDMSKSLFVRNADPDGDPLFISLDGGTIWDEIPAGGWLSLEVKLISFRVKTGTGGGTTCRGIATLFEGN